VENNGGKYSGFFSKKLRAGKRRTYFFDVRSTKQGDFFLTITESKKKFDSDGYESHKIFLYKEDFKKFIEALNETLDHVKTELMLHAQMMKATSHKESAHHVHHARIAMTATAIITATAIQTRQITRSVAISMTIRISTIRKIKKNRAAQSSSLIQVQVSPIPNINLHPA
jgi:uncharacterized glyoxalase superfamily protein PhnB